MKARPFFSALAPLLLVLLPPLLHADDILFTGPVTITGSIITQGPSDDFSKTKPISISNIFSVLGLVNIAKDYRYYFDLSADSFVIAPKNLIPAGSHATSVNGTPTVTVFQYNSGNEAQLDQSKAIQYQANSGDTALNGDLAGSSVLKFTDARGRSTEATKFMVFGDLEGTEVLMQGTTVVHIAP